MGVFFANKQCNRKQTFKPAIPPVAKFAGEIRWMKICWEALDFWKLRRGIVAVGRYQQNMGICECNLEIQLHVSCGSPKLSFR